MSKRIGVFGGTFDPPHFGHLAVVKAALRSGIVEEVVVPVASNPWQKTSLGEVTPFLQRFEMAKIAFSELDAVTVSDIEMLIDGPSYTVMLLEKLAASSGDTFIPIIGADTASSLTTWHRFHDLAANWKFIVINRPGHVMTVPEAVDFESLEMAPVDVSSTDIRVRFAEKKSVEGLVPAELLDYIVQHRLYK